METTAIKVSTVGGVTVWAVQHADGWGWVSDAYTDPFGTPKTGGGMLATIPEGAFQTPEEAGSAGADAVRAWFSDPPAGYYAL